jgi:hypothetical protein
MEKENQSSFRNLLEFNEVTRRSFIIWINYKLSTDIENEVYELDDLSDGRKFLKLLKVITNMDIEIPEEGATRIYHLSTVGKVLKLLQDTYQIPLEHIKAEYIVSGNEEAIMSLTWKIMLMSFGKIDTEEHENHPAHHRRRTNSIQKKGQKTKSDLIQMCQNIFQSSGLVTISDFSSSWKNGVALWFLIRELNPATSLNFKEELKRSDHPENWSSILNRAIAYASSNLNIPKLFSGEEVQSGYVDETCMMLYVFLFLDKLFSKNDSTHVNQIRKSNESVKQFIQNAERILMRIDLTKLATSLDQQYFTELNDNKANDMALSEFHSELSSLVKQLKNYDLTFLKEKIEKFEKAFVPSKIPAEFKKEKDLSEKLEVSVLSLKEKVEKKFLGLSSLKDLEEKVSSIVHSLESIKKKLENLKHDNQAIIDCEVEISKQKELLNVLKKSKYPDFLLKNKASLCTFIENSMKVAEAKLVEQKKKLKKSNSQAVSLEVKFETEADIVSGWIESKLISLNRIVGIKDSTDSLSETYEEELERIYQIKQDVECYEEHIRKLRDFCLKLISPGGTKIGKNSVVVEITARQKEIDNQWLDLRNSLEKRVRNMETRKKTIDFKREYAELYSEKQALNDEIVILQNDMSPSEEERVVFSIKESIAQLSDKIENMFQAYENFFFEFPELKKDFEVLKDGIPQMKKNLSKQQNLMKEYRFISGYLQNFDMLKEVVHQIYNFMANANYPPNNQMFKNIEELSNLKKLIQEW